MILDRSCALGLIKYQVFKSCVNVLKRRYKHFLSSFGSYYLLISMFVLL